MGWSKNARHQRARSRPLRQTQLPKGLWIGLAAAARHLDSITYNNHQPAASLAAGFCFCGLTHSSERWRSAGAPPLGCRDLRIPPITCQTQFGRSCSLKVPEGLVVTHILGRLISVLVFSNSSKPQRGAMFIANRSRPAPVLFFGGAAAVLCNMSFGFR